MIKSRAVLASCTMGRGPNGSSASQIRQARTSRKVRFSDIQKTLLRYSQLSHTRHMFFLPVCREMGIYLHPAVKHYEIEYFDPFALSKNLRVRSQASAVASGR